MVKKEKILVLSIDRDDDIGQKTGHKGPIIGRENMIKVATDFGLADPSDSDFNALFEAVRVYEEVKKDYDATVAAITGDKDRGLKSDREVGRQLDLIINKTGARGVILVTDGADDEQTLPIVQSKIPVISVRRLIIKQAEELESTYYKIKDFIDESLDNPRYSSIILGLPALILILLGVFGIHGARYVLLLLGAFLVVKWFKLEKHIGNISHEFHESLSRQRMAFFIYVLGIIVGILAVYRGYNYALPQLGIGIFEAVASFSSGSILLLWVAATIGWIGRILNVRKKRKGRVFAIPLFGFSISFIIYNAAELILKTNYLAYFIWSIVISLLLIFVAVLLEKKV